MLPTSTVWAGDEVIFSNLKWISLVMHDYMHAGVWVFHVVCYQESCHQISLCVVMFFVGFFFALGSHRLSIP